MNKATQIHLFTVIIYGIISTFGSKLLNIHWIHILNGLMLSAILYHLLDWKYNYEEEDKK